MGKKLLFHYILYFFEMHLYTALSTVLHHREYTVVYVYTVYIAWLLRGCPMSILAGLSQPSATEMNASQVCLNMNDSFCIRQSLVILAMLSTSLYVPNRDRNKRKKYNQHSTVQMQISNIHPSIHFLIRLSYTWSCWSLAPILKNLEHETRDILDRVPTLHSTF